MTRPNFLLILVDDMGFSDVGCYGGEIQTPNVDRLAREGLLFTDFHASAACSPTRSMLLSGTDNHLAGVGVMSEQRANEWPRWNVRGHEGYLNHDVAALPELLQDAGYLTLMSGKWHLGFKMNNNPSQRGFDRSFALLPGATNHWGFEPQFQGNDKVDFIARIPVLYCEDGQKRVVEGNTTNDYTKGFFSTEFYTSNLLKYFNERSDEDKEKPFFAYLPYSAPHWPLQCSKEDRDKYSGVYDEGPDALRLRRLQRLKELGIVGKDVVPHDVVDTAHGTFEDEWENLNAEERKKSARSMEAFAGMVDNVDQNIGRVLEYLESTGELDNTVVLFMSDNGAEGAAYEAYPVLAPELMPILRKYYNNSYDNIGMHDSFVWYGPRWAQASTAPHRLYKMYSTEGGIRVPCIVRYPKQFPQGKITSAFASVMDIMPTLLELAGIKHPASGGPGEYRGHKVHPMRGHSWLSHFSPDRCDTAPDSIYGDEFCGWELFGRASLRMGRFKIVFMPEYAFGKGKWELFDIIKDPGEVNDLSEAQPKDLENMLSAWEKYVEETGVVWGTPLKDEMTWGVTPEDSWGGDPLGQSRAWMSIGEGNHPTYSAVPRGEQKASLSVRA